MKTKPADWTLDVDHWPMLDEKLSANTLNSPHNSICW